MTGGEAGKPGVCIVALGARTPVGVRALPSAAAVRAGIARIREHPFMIDKAGEPFMVAMDITLSSMQRLERMAVLALSALEEVLEPLPVTSPTPIPVFLALPEPDARFGARQARELCATIVERWGDARRLELHPILEGNAAGLVGMRRAMAAIVQDGVPCCVIGGVDSFIDVDLLESLDQAGRILSSSSRWGFPPGEGAGMLALCGAGTARRHGLPVLASIESLGLADEAHGMHSRGICVGVGLASAWGQALAGAGGIVGMQYCDINGERYREHELSYALLRMDPGAFVNAIHYVAPAVSWGHTGAATAPLLVQLPIVSHRRRASPGRRPMIWCGSESGRRGAVVLDLGEEEAR